MTIRHGFARRRSLLVAPWLLVFCSCSNPSGGSAASSAPVTTPTTPAAPADPDKACQGEPVQHVVGSPYTPELGEKVRELSGSTVVRVLHPGEVVTMEFRFDRVNITVDATGVVTQVTCG
jgi:hypothetical protein